ncbi:unnamed protein product, partial [Closterium sp. NIES-54]
GRSPHEWGHRRRGDTCCNPIGCPSGCIPRRTARVFANSRRHQQSHFHRVKRTRAAACFCV